jgi:hypothetical protein
MKKNLFVIITFISFFPQLMAQQIENPGFEFWEEVGLGSEIIEPVDWSTVKTSDDPTISGLAPITWERSTDAHTGQYSVRLHNTSTLGIPVSGTMSNGQYHPNLNTELAWVFTNTTDPRWNMPYNSRPDSIAFWVKFFPVGNDTLQFQALLHVEEATLPPKPENLVNQVAYTRADIGETIENWTRVALAFEYYDNRTPEYILIIITSGNGTTPNVGSYAFYDDIEIIDDGQAIHENPLNKVNIFVSANTLYISNLSEDFMQSTTITLYDPIGRLVWQNKIHSDKISLEPTLNLSGLYIAKISSDDYVMSRKIYINNQGF